MDFIAEVSRERPELKIIFMSAFWRDMKTYKTLTEQLFVNRVINKPFLAREFLLQLDALQAAGPRLAEPAAAGGELQPERGRLHRLPTEESRLDAELAALRTRFSGRLEEKVREIDEAYARARASGDSPAALERVLRLAHRLHGTAGSYGFSEVSAAAGADRGSAARGAAGQARGGAGRLARDQPRAQATPRGAAPPGRGQPGRAPARGRTAGSCACSSSTTIPACLEELEPVARRHLVELVLATNEQQAMAEAQKCRRPGRRHHLPRRLRGERLRAGPHAARRRSRAAMPVAFISQRDRISDRVAAAYAGASLFLTKPIQPQQLATTFDFFATLRGAEQPRVLVVDDDPHFAEHLSAILTSNNMKVTCLSEPLRVLEVMAEVRPDLLLLDVMMPTLSGYDICKLVRAAPEWQSLPIVFLTVKLSARDRLACFEAGGDDYLPKPILPAELLARLRVRLERRRIHEERVSRDALTGLLGRQAFAETVEKRLAENRRLMRPLALCLIDLDVFKSVNDRFGHLAGDRVLQELGKLLRSRFRTEDVRGRWGGEEFVVAFNGEGAATARDMLARVLEEFRRLSFTGDRGESFNCTFSAGVAIFPDSGYTLEELIRAADRRLYSAKEAGRDQIAV